MSKIITALACLATASHSDSAPSQRSRDEWRDMAHEARREWDKLCDENDRLRSEVDARYGAQVGLGQELNRAQARIAELEAEVERQTADLRDGDEVQNRQEHRIAELEHENACQQLILDGLATQDGVRDRRIAELEAALRYFVEAALEYTDGAMAHSGEREGERTNGVEAFRLADAALAGPADGCPECLRPMSEHSPPTVDDPGCPAKEPT